MLGQHCLELGMSPRILVLVLHAGRAVSVTLSEGSHALLPYHACDGVGLSAEKFSLVRLGPVSAAADAQRKRARAMAQAEMQRCEATHRQADDMCLWCADLIKYGENVLGGADLRVG